MQQCAHHGVLFYLHVMTGPIERDECGMRKSLRKRALILESDVGVLATRHDQHLPIKMLPLRKHTARRGLDRSAYHDETTLGAPVGLCATMENVRGIWGMSSGIRHPCAASSNTSIGKACQSVTRCSPISSMTSPA
jgi:hypothetical protein